MAVAQSELSLKGLLLDNLDDTEAILNQLAESLVIGKEKRSSENADSEVDDLVQLFELKQTKFNENLNRANEFAKRQALIEELEAELRLRDEHLDKIQNTFKEAETTLISAIFQANQKLKSIKQAENRKVSPDDLIKYAHRISRTNAVAAPLCWQQGDPERPFPTDVEMRQGWLSRPEQEVKHVGPVETGDLSQRQTRTLPPQTSPRSATMTPPYSQPMPGFSAMQRPGFPSGQQSVGSPHRQQMVPPRVPINFGGSNSPSQGAMIPPPPPYAGRGWSPGRYPSGHPSPQRQMRPGVPPYPQTGITQQQRQSMQPVQTGVPSPRTMVTAYPAQVQGGVGPMRQRRPSAGMTRMTTPTQQQQVMQMGTVQRPNDVETMSSDSSSSSSSDSPS